MNNADLEARLRDVPPDLPDPHDRFGEIERRVRRTRARQRIGAVTVVVAALAVAIPVALLAGDDDPTRDPDAVVATDPQSPSQASQPADRLPGMDLDVPLSVPLTVEATGTATVELGPRPQGATGVSTDLRCLSPGTFHWPDGATLVCDASDASDVELAGDHPASRGYVLELGPRQTRIVIEAGTDMSWQITTTYVRTEPTAWGVTANGETYGVPNDTGQPDLIATSAREGGVIRYARSEDLNAGPADPEQAMAWMRNGELNSVPTYTEDGRTIVGTFEMSGRNADEPVTRLVVGSPPASAENGVVSGVLTVTDVGCVHLATATGTRWLILPWGVQLAGRPDGGVLERFTGEAVAELNREVTFSGSEIAAQQVEAPCGAGQPPFYVTAPPRHGQAMSRSPRAERR